MKLEWNVYREDFNNKEIKVFNIFNHGRFDENVKKDLKECKTKEEFSEKLKKNLICYYWCQAEYEIVLTSWGPRIEKEELDRLNREYEEYYNKYNHAPYNIHVSWTSTPLEKFVLPAFNPWYICPNCSYNTYVRGGCDNGKEEKRHHPAQCCRADTGAGYHQRTAESGLRPL